MTAPTLDDTARAVGALLAALPSQHHDDLPSSLDMTRRTFMDRLVTPATLQASLSVHYDAYLATLLAADLFTGALVCSVDALKNVDHLKQQVAATTQKPMLSGELVLVTLGAWSYHRPDDWFERPSALDDFRAGDDVVDNGTLTSTRPGPYFVALGALVASLATGWRREAMARARSRRELQALCFIDRVLQLTPVPGARELAEDDTDEAGTARATLLAAAALRAHATPERLRSLVEEALGDRSTTND